MSSSAIHDEIQFGLPSISSPSPHTNNRIAGIMLAGRTIVEVLLVLV
jgi:hypothetical protein